MNKRVIKMQADWTDFCNWLRDDIELGPIDIKWSRISGLGHTIIRIDIFSTLPCHVTTALEDKPELCNHEVSYSLARGLMPTLTKAIDENKAYTYFQYFRLEPRV
jgi:hypothetical protein